MGWGAQRNGICHHIACDYRCHNEQNWLATNLKGWRRGVLIRNGNRDDKFVSGREVVGRGVGSIGGGGVIIGLNLSAVKGSMFLQFFITAQTGGVALSGGG